MSQQSISVLTLTVTADGAITNFRAVGFDGAQATVQGQKVMGVAIADAANEDDLAIVTCGTTSVEVGAIIAQGDSLIVDTSGRAIPATGALGVASGGMTVASTAANGAILEGADLPEFIFADAMEAASAVGEFIEILLRR